MDALSGVTIVCWLMGTIPVPELHDGRLRMLWEKLVDTPVRGVVYEGALAAGRCRSRGRAAATWKIPLEVLDADPADHDAWLAAAGRACVDSAAGRSSAPRCARAGPATIRPVAPQMRWSPTS